MLTVVSIKNNDIITDSTDEVLYYRGDFGSGVALGAGDRMGREDWDAGY